MEGGRALGFFCMVWNGFQKGLKCFDKVLLCLFDGVPGCWRVLHGFWVGLFCGLLICTVHKGCLGLVKRWRVRYSVFN